MKRTTKKTSATAWFYSTPGFHSSTAPKPAAALTATADPEYKTRIAADRVTAAWTTPIVTQVDFSDSPLFGGARQQEMF